MTGTARTARALAIRDHLLPLIRAQGATEETGGSGPRMTTWKAGRFDFALRSPFTAWGIKAPPPRPYRAAQAERRADPVLPWGLDVWHGRKVLSLQWDHAGRVEVISFTRGPWEDEALALGPGQNLYPK